MKATKKKSRLASPMPLDWFEDRWTLPVRARKRVRAFWSGGRYPSRVMGGVDCAAWGIPGDGRWIDSEAVRPAPAAGAESLHSELMADLVLRRRGGVPDQSQA